MKFAAIYAPHFPLQAVLRLEAGLRQVPVALLEEASRTARVTALTDSARAAGVREGMTAAQAAGRCPGLAARLRSAEAEAAAARVLLAGALTVSPRVEVTAPGVCTVSLAGLPEGAPERLTKKALGRLAGVGLSVRAGLATSAGLARQAARVAAPLLVVADVPAFLAALPIARMGASADLLEVLHAWGLHTLGALAALPRDDVAQRLGDEALALWDDAHGQDRRPLTHAALPDDFEETLELEDPVETLEPLLFLLRRMLGALVLRLQAAYRVAADLSLTLRLDSGPPHERSFRLPEPTAQPDLLLRVLHAHLEQVRTDAPVVALRLRVEPAPLQFRQQGLFETALKNPARLQETLDRLTGLVGSQNAGCPRALPTRRPDAFTLEPLADAAASAAPEAGLPPGLALRRLRPPAPARVRAEAEAPPTRLESAVASGTICDTRGPWHVSGDWWLPPAQSWSRTEWDAALEDGVLLRLVHTPNGQWWVEGFYD